VSSNWGVSLHHQRARCPGGAVRARRHGVADEDSEHAVTTLAVSIRGVGDVRPKVKAPRPAAS
jgi:hypothetical protein